MGIATRTPLERELDNARVETVLQKSLPAYDRCIHTKIVGVTAINDDGTPRQDIIKQVKQFDPVDLVRDPDDGWDRNAIEVHASYFEPAKLHADGPAPAGIRDGQIGHIEKEIAAELAPLIDAGQPWRAVVTRVAGYISIGVGVMLYRLSKEVPAPIPAPADPGVHELHCAKCGYEWLPRSRELPKACPRCNCKHWDHPSKRVLTHSESAAARPAGRRS